MAIPRVFVSSTYYDLRYIRENLKYFLRNLGLEPALSETGGVFYDPQKHVKDACLAEVRTCQLFVLVIGGRFGSEYKDTGKSITNEEFLEAVKTKIPIFALVEQQVYGDYQVYTKNKDNPALNRTKIQYPATDDCRVFDFIAEVESNSYNNAVFPFSNYGELQDYLRQQWAGMLHGFLTGRSESERAAESIALTGIKENIAILAKQIAASVGSAGGKETAKLLVTVYQAMLKYQCISDLGYIGIRPSPQDIIRTPDYLAVSKGKLKVVAEAASTIYRDGAISPKRLQVDTEEYRRLREEILAILEQSGKPPESFLKELE